MGSLPWHASDAQMAFWEDQVMDKLERFKQLSGAMPKEKKVELYQQFVASPEAGINSIITLAAAQGLELSQVEVSELIKSIDVDDEFDDIELDAVALTAIAGGRHEDGKCCQEEAHDEPWGRCPGMRPMRKWLFGRQPVAQS